MRRLITGCLFAVFALAIAVAPAQAQAKKRGDQNKITRADLNESGGTIVTAYDAVRILRPRWLNPALAKQASSNVLGGGGGATTLIVYIDGTRQPDVERSLNSVKAAFLIELQYFDQNRSVQEYGPGHEAGVIKVTTVNKEH